MPTRLTFHIRWMIRRDWPEVLAIESASFDDPWTEQGFTECFRHHRNRIGMVATESQSPKSTVLGFFIYELLQWQIDLINLAVHPDFRRLGVGFSILDRLRGKLSMHRRRRVETLVRDDNLSAHLFFAAYGYRAVGIEPRHCHDGQDAYRFVYRCQAEEAELSRHAGERIRER